MTAIKSEAVKLAQGVKCSYGNNEITNLRRVSGGAIQLKKVNTSSAAAEFQSNSTGRGEISNVVVTFANAPDNIKIIQECIKVYKNPKLARPTLTIAEVTRSNAAGMQLVYAEVLPCSITMPQANNNEKVLETTIEFWCERLEQTAGGEGA